MPKQKIKYQIGKDDSRWPFEIEYNHCAGDEVCDFEIEDMAQYAAEDFFNNHDGWEHKWPIDFFIYDSLGKLLGNCEVRQEVEPVFYAEKKGAPQNAVEQNGHIAQQAQP